MHLYYLVITVIQNVLMRTHPLLSVVLSSLPPVCVLCLVHMTNDITITFLSQEVSIATLSPTATLASLPSPTPPPPMPSVPLRIHLTNDSPNVTGSTMLAVFETNKPVDALQCRLVGETQFQDCQYD